MRTVINFEQGPLVISTLIPKANNMKSSIRTWKTRLEIWGYKKNIRAQDMQDIVARRNQLGHKGKRATFLNGETRISITAKRFDNFTRRRTKEVPPSAGR